MKKLNNGFSLLELLLTITIAAFLFTALATILTTIQNGVISFYKLTNEDRPISIISRYLFRDISGAFVPAYNPQEPRQKSLVENCFELKSSGSGRLKSLFFVTNNPLPVYNGNPMKIVRCIYKLEPAEDGLFNLMRSHDMALDFSGEPKFYKVLSNLKDILVSASYYKMSEDKDEELVKENSWSAKKMFEDKKEPLLPQQIVLSITTEKDNYFEIVIPIYGYSTAPEKISLDQMISQQKSEPTAQAEEVTHENR